MAGPVLEPIEQLTKRVAEEAKSAVLGHKIGNPGAPELDWVVLIYTRDEARWMVYRSNMGLRPLARSLQAAVNLMVDHLKQNKG